MPALHAPRPAYFCSAYLAVGLALVGDAAWTAHRLGASAPLWVLAVGSAVALFGLAAVWLDPVVDDPRKPSSRPLLHSPTRWRRLLKGLEFLPSPKPPGWKGPCFATGTSGWFYVTPEGAIVVMCAMENEAGYGLLVELVHADRTTRIADSRAAEILAHFRSVGPFAERATAEMFGQTFPGARAWTALPCDPTAALPVPPESPELPESPWNDPLAAARRHLPATLPLGWSVPVAVIEQGFRRKEQAWMILDDDLVLLVTLVTSRRRAKLAVTLFDPDAAVSDARIHDVLRHFRGIRKFVKIEFTSEIPGARRYLGEIETDSRSVPPHHGDAVHDSSLGMP